MDQNGTIEVVLLRNDKKERRTYILRDFTGGGTETTNPISQDLLKKQKDEEKLNIFKEKHKLAPTVQDLQKKERNMMMQHGKALNDVETNGE